MQSSCATSHKLHITVVRFKTKLELSKNFNFPKNKFHDHSTITSVLCNFWQKLPSWCKVIGNLLLTFWRSLLPPLSGWSTKCMLFGRIVQGLVRLGDTYNYIFAMLISDLIRILPEMHVRSPSSGPTYSPWCMRYSTSTMPWSSWFIVRIS
jgi:hypothetical protein